MDFPKPTGSKLTGNTAGILNLKKKCIPRIFPLGFFTGATVIFRGKLQKCQQCPIYIASRFHATMGLYEGVAWWGMEAWLR